MEWIQRELTIRSSRGNLIQSAEGREGAREARGKARNHNMSGSNGSLPSANAARTNSSSFGLGRGSPMARSHAASSLRASRKSAKSATSARCASGSCSYIRTSSCVPTLMLGFYSSEVKVPAKRLLYRRRRAKGERRPACVRGGGSFPIPPNRISLAAVLDARRSPAEICY